MSSSAVSHDLFDSVDLLCGFFLFVLADGIFSFYECSELWLNMWFSPSSQRHSVKFKLNA